MELFNDENGLIKIGYTIFTIRKAISLKVIIAT